MLLLLLLCHLLISLLLLTCRMVLVQLFSTGSEVLQQQLSYCRVPQQALHLFCCTSIQKQQASLRIVTRI
jgi:hypothetical protein